MKKTGIIPVQLLYITLSYMILTCISGCSSPLEEVREEFNLRIYPSIVEIEIDEETVVSVWVDEAYNLIAVRFTISFDPSMLEVTKILTSGPDLMFYDEGAEVIEIENKIDNTLGLFSVGIGAQQEGLKGVEGSGVLAEISIRAKNTGQSSLKFVDDRPDDVITIYSTNSQTGWEEMPVKTYDGIVFISETQEETKSE